jgi:hypothetical protein
VGYSRAEVKKLIEAARELHAFVAVKNDVVTYELAPFDIEMPVPNLEAVPDSKGGSVVFEIIGVPAGIFAIKGPFEVAHLYGDASDPDWTPWIETRDAFHWSEAPEAPETAKPKLVERSDKHAIPETTPEQLDAYRQNVANMANDNERSRQERLRPGSRIADKAIVDGVMARFRAKAEDDKPKAATALAAPPIIGSKALAEQPRTVARVELDQPHTFNVERQPTAYVVAPEPPAEEEPTPPEPQPSPPVATVSASAFPPPIRGADIPAAVNLPPPIVPTLQLEPTIERKTGLRLVPTKPVPKG